MQRKSIVLVFFLCWLVAGCSAPLPEEDQLHGMWLAEDSQVQVVPEWEREREELPAAPELFADALPDHVQSPFDESALQAEIRQVMEACRDLYRAMGRQEDLFHIFRPTPAQLEQVAAAIGELGFPTSGEDMDLYNEDKLLEFYQLVESQETGELGVYELDRTGDLARVSFLTREGEIYYTRIQFGWDMALEPYIRPVELTPKLDFFFLTQRNCLVYGVEKTGFAMVRGGYRLQPLGTESRALRDRYLAPLGSYIGHNVLLEDWDEDSLETLGFNDIFEMLFGYERGLSPDSAYRELYQPDVAYKLAIPGADFEEIITQYFPVEAEQLREWAVYDARREVYAWVPLISGGRSPRWEVADWTWQPDGSLVLRVDATDLSRGIDCCATSTLTVLPAADGGFRYLSNAVEVHEPYASLLPVYQPRV